MRVIFERKNYKFTIESNDDNYTIFDEDLKTCLQGAIDNIAELDLSVLPLGFKGDADLETTVFITDKKH